MGARSTQKLVEIHNKQFLTFQFKGVYTQFEPVKGEFVIHDNLTELLSLTKLLNPFKALSQYCICLVGMKKGANRTIKVKRPLQRQKDMFGARLKIMWEEQLVDPAIR